MRERTVLLGAAAIGAALILPHLMPRYIASKDVVYRVNPISGAVCVMTVDTATPYALGTDARYVDTLCSATREAAAEAIREELSRRE